MQRRALLLALSLVTLVSSVAIACNVPVFRYALERWPADPYEVVVLHDGPLDADDQAHLETLRRASRQAEGKVNCVIRDVNLTDRDDPFLKRLWQEQRPKDGGPLLALMYPRNAREVPDRLVSAKPLSEEAINGLLDSPVRAEVAEKLLSGDSAVWIFVPSGDKAQDDVALATLTEQAKWNQDNLELPPQEELEADEFFRQSRYDTAGP